MSLSLVLVLVFAVRDRAIPLCFGIVFGENGAPVDGSVLSHLRLRFLFSPPVFCTIMHTRFVCVNPYHRKFDPMWKRFSRRSVFLDLMFVPFIPVSGSPPRHK